MDINALLAGLPCTCGHPHTCDIQAVYVEPDAMAHLRELCSADRSILIVADENTYRVAGAQTERYLEGRIAARQIFPGSPLLVPNEDAIEAVEAKADGITKIIGIGSGVVQDLCKYVSFNRHIPYYIVATAPSMDGYASSGAAMITGGMKVTYSAHVPAAILADTEIIRNAPMEMIQAGYGDIIGKFSALNDWKLSSTVNGEYFCQQIYDLVYDTLQRTVPLAKALLARDEQSIRTLTEALSLVGIAMAFVGTSRPASGSEHHFSHFFEITGILRSKPYLAHGIDVAYATVLTARIRQKILAARFPARCFHMERTEYEQEMHRVFGPIAQSCIDLQDKMGRYGQERAQTYLAHEEEIRAILAECPRPEEIEQILNSIGLSMDAFCSVYSPETLDQALHDAKDLKDRYTVLWMYYDLFGMEALEA